MTHRVSPDGLHLRPGTPAYSPTPVVAARPHYSTKQKATGGPVFYLPTEPLEPTPVVMPEWLADYLATHEVKAAPASRIDFGAEDEPANRTCGGRPGCTNEARPGRTKCEACRKVEQRAARRKTS